MRAGSETAAGRTGAALQRLDHVEQNVPAHGIHRPAPLLLQQGLVHAGLQCSTFDDLRGPQAGQEIGLVGLAGHGRDLVAEAGQQRHRNAADTAGRTGHQHRRVSRLETSLFQLVDTECGSQAGCAEYHRVT